MMMDQRSYLYMWAVVPPPPLADSIDQLRKEFSEHFQCFKALKPPAHLTLFTLFSLPTAIVDSHLDEIKRHIAALPSFSIELRNFGFFEHARSPVVFIDVVQNSSLQMLHAEISRQSVMHFELESEGRTFHPHVTIGYRDISPEIFPIIKQAYRERLFSVAFDVQHICLFRHNGARWELQHQLPLETNVTEQGTLF